MKASYTLNLSLNNGILISYTTLLLPNVFPAYVCENVAFRLDYVFSFFVLANIIIYSAMSE